MFETIVPEKASLFNELYLLSDMIREVEAGGFVLAGGHSRRMGRDKALLEFRGRTLIEHVAARVAEAAGSVTLIGPVERYSHLGLPVIPDKRQDSGPLAGIEAALLHSTVDRALIVACDMPDAPLDLLRALIDTPGDCVLPRTLDGRLHPLCAVWSKSVLPSIVRSLDAGLFKVTGALQGHHVTEVNWKSLENTNTPAEFVRAAG